MNLVFTLSVLNIVHNVGLTWRQFVVWGKKMLRSAAKTGPLSEGLDPVGKWEEGGGDGLNTPVGSQAAA